MLSGGGWGIFICTAVEGRKKRSSCFGDVLGCWILAFSLFLCPNVLSCSSWGESQVCSTHTHFHIWASRNRSPGVKGKVVVVTGMEKRGRGERELEVTYVSGSEIEQSYRIC